MANNDKALSAQEQTVQLRELAKRVDNPKPKSADLKRFREMLREHPQLWRVISDLGWHAEQRLIDNLNMPKSAREALRVGLEALKRDLGTETAAPLERLLIDQIALSWLQLRVVEIKHGLNTSRPIGIPQADQWDRTLAAAQRRHLRAIESLARVRRLLGPAAVQVNIGAQQVNVAGNVTPGKVEDQAK